MITADITLLATKRGGREEPIPAGEYRGIISARGQHFAFTCLVPFEGGFKPGETRTVDIEFVFPHLAMPFFKAGVEFNLWEGGTVGHGTVLTAW